MTIKWSAFTSGGAISSIDSVVGLQGGNNVQWTWAQARTFGSTATTFTSTAAANASSFVWGNGAQTMSLSTRDSGAAGSIGVGYLRATTTNTPTVLDIMPNGSAGGVDPTGVAWIDLCDRDLSAPNSNNFQTLLLTCLSTGECRVGTHYGGTGTNQILKIGGSQVQILSQAFGSATQYGYFRDLGLYIGGSGTENFSVNSFNTNGAMSLSSGMVQQWSSTTTVPGQTFDIGLARNAAGILEVNSATAGTFRDVVVRKTFYGATTGIANNTGMIKATADSNAGIDVRTPDDTQFAELSAGSIFARGGNMYIGTGAVGAWSSGQFLLARNSATGGPVIGWAASNATASADTGFTAPAAATIQLGLADAAAPVAQTLSVQNVITGTTNTAGVNLTLNLSRSTGNQAGGALIIQSTQIGGSGSSVNSLSLLFNIGFSAYNQTNTGGGYIPSISSPSGGGAGTVNLGNTNSPITFGASSASSSHAFMTSNTFAMRSGMVFGWSNNSADAWGLGSPTANGFLVDTTLARDGAGIMGLRNSTNPMLFYVYNTFTDASNYERVEIGPNAGGVGANVFGVYVTKGGSGTLRNLSIGTSSGTLLLNDGNGTITITGGEFAIPSRGLIQSAPNTQSGTSYSMGTGDASIITSNAGTVTITLLAAGSWTGRWLHVKNTGAGTLVSASSNVVPIGSTTAGTAILAGGPGKWAILQSDGSNWIILASN